MSTPGKGRKRHPEIEVGRECLLHLMRQYFMVEVIEVGAETLRVSFPGRDYPVEGMPADIQFHDKAGFYSYPSVVVEGPDPKRPGIVLRFPKERRRAQHRDTCRVATDLTVQVRDQAHVRHYNATLLNLSVGGALVETEAPFDFHTGVEMVMSLPGEPTHAVLAQVVHIGEARAERETARRLVGLRFVGIEPAAIHSISRYILSRLKDLYPGESQELP